MPVRAPLIQSGAPSLSAQAYWRVRQV